MKVFTTFFFYIFANAGIETLLSTVTEARLIAKCRTAAKQLGSSLHILLPFHVEPVAQVSEQS